MVNSVNSNSSALAALRSLNETSKELEQTEKRIGTGLKIATARDNAAIYSVAQNLRGEVNSLTFVRSSLDRAGSIGDVAVAAGETISEIFIQLRDKALAAKDVSTTAENRAAYQADFDALLKQVVQIVQSASFDGVNLLNNSHPAGVDFIADADGQDIITLGSEDFSLSGPIISLSTANNLTTQSSAAAAFDAITASIVKINGALSRLGASVQQINNHGVFVGKLQDALIAGVGELVDADLGKEAAMLQALQVKQQLSVQSLSIANSSPQTILSLFQNL